MTKKLLSEGAESLLYSAKLFGVDIVIKERQPKQYRIAQLDQEIRKSRTRREARILARLRKAGMQVPALVAVGQYTIYMGRVSGTLLKDLPTPSQKLFNRIGAVLAAMHRNDVAHGDFTPANIMIDKDMVTIIDFGLSETTNSIEEKALDLLLMKRSVTQKQYAEFLDRYAKAYSDSAKVIKRLEAIERRGRYQVRTLA